MERIIENNEKMNREDKSMRFFRNMLILIILGAGMYIYFEQTNSTPESLKDDLKETLNVKGPNELNKNVHETEKKSQIKLQGELYKWIGKDEASLIKEFGKPKRVDKSAYGYKWLIFTNDVDQYIQFGIENDRVETLYVIGNNLSTSPFTIGTTYDALNEKYKFKEYVSYEKGISSYKFHLKEEDLSMRPLVKVDEALYAQLYFDTFTKKLSAVRILSSSVLLKHRPYEIEYRGKLPETPKLNDEEWQTIEAGLEQQIFDITNIMRNTHNLSKLKWEENVRSVAFLHSKDMENNQYFSHYGLDGTGLKERLAEKSVVYTAAGENIAAQYPDSPAAMEGWLNSKGHREALLNNEYTHIGVGVYQFYYTQNFLKKP